MKMSEFDRLYKTSYQCTIIALCCTIFELFDTEEYHLEIKVRCNIHWTDRIQVHIGVTQ